MGLCRCDKPKVSNLFCFKHQVNVCEECMIRDHERCVVQTYLQWLNDSSFQTTCNLCCLTLDQGDILRLLCYDLFHLECINKYFNEKLKLTCPKCGDNVIPSDNCVSPVANQLRNILNQSGWIEPDHIKHQHQQSQQQSHPNESGFISSRIRDTSIAVNNDGIATKQSQSMNNEDKYRQKSIIERIKRFIKLQTIIKPKCRNTVPCYIRTIAILFIVAFLIFSIASIVERLSVFHL
ncbi:hypothetical protein GJ496_005044 [Pomphorhynchus laevis]|nr:hypothetical protein GJ496_005044 [Pomphorhynchus laevis]